MIIDMSAERLEKWKAEKATKDAKDQKVRELDKAQCGAFYAWLEHAHGGDEYQYHIGSFVANKRIAQVVRNSYERGEVIMFQRRVGKNFAYFVRRRGLKDAGG